MKGRKGRAVGHESPLPQEWPSREPGHRLSRREEAGKGAAAPSGLQKAVHPHEGPGQQRPQAQPLPPAFPGGLSAPAPQVKNRTAHGQPLTIIRHPPGPGVQGKGGDLSSPPLGPFGVSAPRSPAETLSLVEAQGRVGSARRAGGPEAAGWVEFMGCGEAAGPDPDPRPRAHHGSGQLWLRCSWPHAPLHACSGASSRRGSPKAPPSPPRSPHPFAARAPGRAHRPRHLRLPWRAGQDRGAGAVSGGSRPASAGSPPRSLDPAARKRRAGRARWGRS